MRKVIARAVCIILTIYSSFGTISHIQAQDTLEISNDLFFVGAGHDTLDLTINVSGESSWTTRTGAGWLGFSPESGSGDTLVKVLVAANPDPNIRRDTAFFLSNGLSRYAIIIQDPFVCPQAESLSVDSVAASFVQLSWDTVENGSGYFLRYRLENSGASWILLDTLNRSGIVLQGLIPASTYEVEVQTQCDNSQAAWSNTLIFSTEDPCEVPDSLRSTVLPDRKVALAWNEDTFAVSYALRYREEEAQEWVEIAFVGSPDTVLENLTLNTLYEWQVRANCANKISDWSESAAFAILTCNPPLEIQVDSVDFDRVWVSWQAAINAIRYELRIRPEGASTWTDIPATADTLRVLAGLMPDTTYQWEVRTRCSSDRSEWIAGSEFRTLKLPAISIVAPEDSSLVRLPFSVSFLAENWPLAFGGRQVQYFLDDVLLDIGFTQQPLTFTDLSPGTYEVKIQLARPDSSLTEFFDSVTLEVLSPLVLELTPNSLTFPVEGDTLNIALSSNSTWSFPANTSGIFLNPISGAGNSIVQVGLSANGSVKEFRDTLVISSEGQTDSLLLIQAPAPCAPPSTLEVLEIGTNQARLSWNAVSGADEYIFRYRRTGSSEPWTEQSAALSNEFLLDGLLDKTRYSWQVRIDCGVFLSAWSAVDTFRTEEFCPVPGDLQTSIGEDSTVFLEWGINEFATEFQIRYREASEEVWIIGQRFPRVDTLLQGLKVNVSYVWQVRTYCEESFSPWSEIDTFLIFSCGAPTDLMVNAISDTTASVSWEGGINSLEFILRYREMGTPIWSRIPRIRGTDTLIASLNRDMSYEWQVQSICAEDSSIWSSGPAFTTTGPPFVAIQSPIDSANVGNPFNLRFILRNWELSPGGRSLAYFVNGVDSGRVFSPTPITLNNLPNGFHTLAVQLVDSLGNFINATDSVVVEVIPDPILLASPNELFFPAAGDTFEVQLSSDIAWSVSSGVDWVDFSDSEGNGNDTLRIWVAPNPTFQNRLDTLVISGGSLSDTVFLVQAGSVCQPLINLRATNIQDTSVVLSWAASEQAVLYSLRYKLANSTDNWVLVDTLALPKLQLLNLTPDTTYWWQVRNDCGPVLSNWSDTATFTTLIPCVVPENPKVDSLSNTFVRLSWQASDLATGYFVRYRKQGASAWASIPQLEDTLVNITGLSLDTAYEWEVRASCQANFSAWIPGPVFQTLLQTPGCGVPQGLTFQNLTDSKCYVELGSCR